MCVLLLSSLRRIVLQSSPQPGGILRRLTLTQGFQTLCGVLKTIFFAGLLVSPMLAVAKAQSLRPHEMVISDLWSGAAIAGYDPVSYFVDLNPKPGRADLQFEHAGNLWQFSNAGNLEAFREHPDAYIPAFGGYDPVALASGVIVPGSPRHFLVHDGRLYLFRREENRDLFRNTPKLAGDATRLWPELSRQLSP